MVSLMLQQLMIVKDLIPWYLAFSSESVSESGQTRHCNVMLMARKINDKNFILYAWDLLGLICLEKWITNKWMNFGDPTNQAIDGAAIHTSRCTFDYVCRFWIFVICVCRIPLTLDFGKDSQNKSRQEINIKLVIQVIRVIVRILLLP